jgi:hypothetical protein
VRAALAEICNAEDRQHALIAVESFEADFRAKFPKAAAKITGYLEGPKCAAMRQRAPPHRPRPRRGDAY